MADKTIRGRFVWHELMTADSAAAHAFYDAVLGWKMQPWEHDPSYAMFAAATGPLGGTVAQSADAPGWIHYIGAADIEATVQQAKDLGASVVTEITPTGGGGRYAVLTDPQGATFGVYGAAEAAGRDKPPRRGEFSWHELVTTDSMAALAFYGALFGWDKLGEYDMGPLGVYYLFGRNGTPLGGLFNKTSEMPGGPAWLGYVRVKDVQKTVKKAKSAGGTLTHGPMEVPGGDWVAQFLDPHGTPFAVHVAKADVEPAAAEPVAVAAPAPAKVRRKQKTAPVRKSAPVKQAAKKKKATATKKPAKQRRAAAKSVKRPARKAATVRKAPKKKQKRTVARTRPRAKAGRKARKGK